LDILVLLIVTVVVAGGDLWIASRDTKTPKGILTVIT
jgi:hypothetical protein